MNALFLKDLAQKTRRGLHGRVLQGFSGGGLCYGYDLLPGEIGVRRINDKQAAGARTIFRDYAAGLSPRAIARRLNKRGIAGPSNRPWRDTAIRGHFTRGTGILNNELYVGRLVWNRLTYLKDPASGRRRSRLNPPSQWIIQEVPALRIVDDALWEAVKTRQGPSARVIRWPMREPHAFGKSAVPATYSAVSSIAKSAAARTPQLDGTTSPAPLLAAVATVLTVKASVGARSRHSSSMV